MATYPALKWLKGSTVEWLDGTRIDRAENGAVKARNPWPTKKVGKVQIKHLLDAAQRATLEAFYDGNRRLSVEIASTLTLGAMMSCVFVRPPDYERLSSRLWAVTVNMVGR